jgi:hypothetical protein
VHAAGSAFPTGELDTVRHERVTLGLKLTENSLRLFDIGRHVIRPYLLLAFPF